MSKRRNTCRACKALLGYTCTLGYKNHLFVSYAPPYRRKMIPEERCPKPLTLAELAECKENQ